MHKLLAYLIGISLFLPLGVSASILGTQQGGTGIGGTNPYIIGDLLYASGVNTLSKQGIGSDGQCLQVAPGGTSYQFGTCASGSWATSSEAYYWSQYQPLYYTGGLSPFLAGTTTVGLRIGGSTLLATSSGSVGIGATSTPWAQLSVNPNGVTGPEFAIGSSTATHFMVSNGGLVGIGTTTPYGLLSIQSSTASNPNVYITKSDSGTASQNGGSLTFENNHAAATARAVGTVGGTVNFNYSQPTSGATQTGARIQALVDVIQSGSNTPTALAFSTFQSAFNLNERMRITSTGNVGIASSSPWALLSVDANGLTGPAFAIGSSTLTNFQVNNGGGVQIVGPKTISAGNCGTHPLCIIPQTRNDNQSVVYFGIDPNTGLAGTIGVTGSGLNLGDRDLTVLFQEERAGITINGSASGGTTGGSTNVRTVTINPSSYNAYGSELETLHITSQTITEALPFTTQRFNQITQPTLTATTTANTFIGTTSTFYIGGAPRVTASGAASTSIGLLIDPGTAMAATTNASTTIGLEAFAPSGGASNFAAVFLGGNVGINTANPTSPLTVAGNILSTSNSAAAITSTGGFSSLTGQYFSAGSVNLSFNAGNSLTNDIFIRASNKYVGLSTTTPSSKLDIAGITPVLTLTDTTAGVDGQHFFMTNNNGAFSIGTTTDTFTSTSTYLTINNLGRVGIGTTNPLTTLDVNGTASSTQVFVGGTNATRLVSGSIFFGSSANVISSSGSQILYGASNTTGHIFNGTGNVGIATTSPVEKLTVQGNLFVQGNATTSNATTTAFNVSSNHITIGSNTGFISGTTTRSFNIASTTLDAMGKSPSIGSTTLLMMNYPTAIKLLGFYCTASTTGTALVTFSHDNGNITQTSTCTSGGYTNVSTNNTWTANENFNVIASSTTGNVNRITVTPSFISTSD